MQANSDHASFPDSLKMCFACFQRRRTNNDLRHYFLPHGLFAPDNSGISPFRNKSRSLLKSRVFTNKESKIYQLWAAL